ncbi:MAG: DM13 domain-containing protein [Gemmatimonadales bacterium]
MLTFVDMGAAVQKAAGDYAITKAGGKSSSLTDDFSVASGSDLYLVLANGETPDKGAIWLGKLQHATGAQTYDLPKGKDLSNFTRLLVWSKKEKRAAASAEWHPVGGGSMGHM